MFFVLLSAFGFQLLFHACAIKGVYTSTLLFFFPGVVLVFYFLLKPETIHVLIFQETHTHSRPIFMVSFNFNFLIFIF